MLRPLATPASECVVSQVSLTADDRSGLGIRINAWDGVALQNPGNPNRSGRRGSPICARMPRQSSMLVGWVGGRD